MAKYIEVGSDVIEFPDSMTDAQIEKVLREQYSPSAPADNSELARIQNRASVLRPDATRKGRAAQIKQEMAKLDPYTVGEDGYSVSVDNEALQRKKELEKELETLEVGSTGETTGSMIGGVGGAAAGAAAGLVFGPVGAIVGGIIGSLVGSTAGVYAGTKYDLSKVPTISEIEAAQMMKDRLVENAIFDVGGSVLLLAGGKLLKVTGASKRLADFAKKYLGEGKPMSEVADPHGPFANNASTIPPRNYAEKRADKVAETSGWKDIEGFSDALDTESAVREMANKGVLPTRGQVTGKPGVVEQWLRRTNPDKFAEQERRLLEVAEENRKKALDQISPNGFKDDPALLGDTVKNYVERADKAIKDKYAPIRAEVDSAGVQVNLTGVKRYVDDVLAKDAAARGSLLKPGERESLERLSQDIGDTPLSDVTSALDFRSGNGAKIRDLDSPDAPSDYFKKVLVEMNKRVDGALTMGTRNLDEGLRTRFNAVSKEYGETMGDLYSPTMQKILRSNPEKIGQIIAAEGNVTQIREFKAALARMFKLDPKTDTNAVWKAVQRGYMEQTFNSVEDLAKLGKWMNDPKFRSTFSEMFPTLTQAKMRIQRAAKIAEIATSTETKESFATLLSSVLGGVGTGLYAGDTGAGAAAAAGLYVGQKGLQRMLLKAMLSPNEGLLNKLGAAVFWAEKAGKNAALKGAELKKEFGPEITPVVAPRPIVEGLKDVLRDLEQEE